MLLRNLFEMPISGIHTYGDMNNAGSFRKNDLNKISTPQAKEKIVRVLKKAPVDIELHFVNLPKEIPNLNKHFDNDVGIYTEEWFETKYGFKLKSNSKALNMVYVENEGDNRIGLTPWIIAHRMSHCFAMTTSEKNTNI